MAGFDDLLAFAEEAVERLGDIVSALQDLPDNLDPGTGGGGGGGEGGDGGLPALGGKGKGGGLLGGIGGIASKFAKRTALGLGVGALGLGGKAIADGVLGASRGGDFGASAAASLNRAAASIPIAGELGGFSALNRVTKGVEGDLNSITNSIARYGGSGSIRPEVRKILASEFSEQNRNVELDRQANSAASEAVLTQSARGLGAGAEAVAGLGTQINSFLQAIGLNQHQ